MFKIGIFSKHWGLAHMMRNVLEDYDVRIVDAVAFPPEHDFKKTDGTEDLMISTMPHEDLKDYHGEKPVILYATDPIYEWVKKDVVRIQQEKWCTTVVAEDCFPFAFFPIKPKYKIPFVCNPKEYASYTGEINKVAVVNRKARSRWTECVRGATGVPYTLEQFLGDIPFDVIDIPTHNDYRQTLGKYKVLFYFSNSPYTIVMFEAMAIKMPTVAFNHHHHSTYKPIEKYINNYGITQDKIRMMLKNALNSPIKTEEYKVMSFENVKLKWNNLIKEILC